jgi:glycosyltransferase involved in cell wall biosynthesis
MKKNILLSFIIPAHNEEKTIAQVLNPIFFQIKDLKEKCEVIVVNDGSNDRTVEIIKNLKYKIKLLNFEKGHSAAFSRNRGAEQAKGKYLIFLDADQIIEDNFVNNLVSLITKQDYEALSYFVYSYKPKTIFQRAWVAFRKVHLCRGFIFRKDIFDKLKFDERLFYIEDNDLWDRFKSAGYKLTDTGFKIYHIDTESLDDFIRQRKWHGRGILCGLLVKKKIYFLRYFAPCILIFFAYFSLWFLIAYLFLMWVYFSIRSKDPINSFLWVIIDYIGRFISLFYFLKELILRKLV